MVFVCDVFVYCCGGSIGWFDCGVGRFFVFCLIVYVGVVCVSIKMCVSVGGGVGSVKVSDW